MDGRLFFCKYQIWTIQMNNLYIILFITQSLYWLSVKELRKLNFAHCKPFGTCNFRLSSQCLKYCQTNSDLWKTLILRNIEIDLWNSCMEDHLKNQTSKNFITLSWLNMIIIYLMLLLDSIASLGGYFLLQYLSHSRRIKQCFPTPN